MYDLIVIGLGAMGSATAYHAASRGHRVLGLDAYERNHANGSSHGRSRIIRESYAEGPEYVPLVQRAYKLWRDLEEESSRSLLTIIGGVYIGSPGTEIVRGVLRSAEEHGLACDYLSAAELMSRFPGFRVPEDMVAVYEANGGVLDAEACVGAHLDLAARHGAELRHGEPVLRWAADGGGVRVETAAGSYTGDRLVIAAGPWIGGLLADLSLPLAVWRVYNTFFEPTRPEFEVGRCPFYLLEVPEGTYYGLPSLPGQGLKAGRHDAGEVSTPQNVRRTVDGSEVEAIRSVLERYMPGAAGALKATTTCVYTVTPDADFVIDRHPEHPQVVYASPCSGHGFKFSSAIGEVLCDLALEGTSAFDVAVFSAERFGIGAGRK
ncbi:MAG TPA: N-methyl-L-tryptophan oxidase [Chloroflexia bacterium]|nr:N-methyl-L-tryptophan oxidase [Chloroflexia bacterium]